MNWTYLMYLPALVSALWALLILATKKHPTRAQILLAAAMLLIALSETLATIIFRARTQNLFIYQYIFQITAILAAPIYYIAVCALTEPRGSSIRQRHSLLIPLLFILALSTTVSILGPRRYQHLCLLFRFDHLFPLHGDTLWNLAATLSYPLFWTLTAATSLILLLLASRKIRTFQARFNSYYADTLGAPKLNSTPIHLIAWLFLPLAAASIALAAFRPQHAKPLLIAIASLLAILQFLLGRYAYSLNHDAAYLARLVKIEN